MGVNSFEYFGETIFDISEDTVTADVLPEGVTAHDANGDPIVGTKIFVEKVNGKTGKDVVLEAKDVGADSAGTAASAVSGHNIGQDAHNDIRLLIKGLSERVNAIANSDDATLDDFKEVVAYIKSNKALIDEITSKKINYDDIINNLETNLENKPLSAAQGVIIKGLIDNLDKTSIGLSNVENIKQYSENNEPPYPVRKVNQKTGDVTLAAKDVGARPDTWMPTALEVGARPSNWTPSADEVGARPSNWTPSADEVGARPSNWMPTAEDVGADKEGTAASAVSGHNIGQDAHNDIRLLIKGLSERVNAIANSDDATLDDFKEVVAYIKSNKALIDEITSKKINYDDIINNLETNLENKPLSAAQGVIIKGLIDELVSGKLDASKLTEAINTALAQAKASGEFDGESGVGIDEVTINDDGELEITYTDGNSTNVGKVKGEDGVLSSEQEKLLGDLKNWYDKEHYQNMIGTFTATVAGGTFLLGSAVESEFTWDFDKLPTSISEGIVDEDAENEGLEYINDPSEQGQISEEFTASTETEIEYKIKGVYAGPYGDEIAEKSWIYYFRNKRYWGMAKEPAKVNGAFITSLSKSEFATTQNKSFNLNDKSTDKYIWYCYPARFGTSVFTGNGLPGGFDYIGLVNDEESLKVLKESFYVYRSTEMGIGTADIVVNRG